jgi:hypothetical protein
MDRRGPRRRSPSASRFQRAHPDRDPRDLLHDARDSPLRDRERLEARRRAAARARRR